MTEFHQNLLLPDEIKHSHNPSVSAVSPNTNENVIPLSEALAEALDEQILSGATSQLHIAPEDRDWIKLTEKRVPLGEEIMY